MLITVDYLSKNFKIADKKSEIGNWLRLHDLGYSFASNLVRKGASIYNVSKLLGHSKVSTTEIYSHLQIDDLRETIANFD